MGTHRAVGTGKPSPVCVVIPVTGSDFGESGFIGREIRKIGGISSLLTRSTWAWFEEGGKRVRVSFAEISIIKMLIPYRFWRHVAFCFCFCFHRL